MSVHLDSDDPLAQVVVAAAQVAVVAWRRHLLFTFYHMMQEMYLRLLADINAGLSLVQLRLLKRLSGVVGANLGRS